jgi:hypothetical protein
VAAPGAAEEDRELVADELAATAGEEGGRLIKHARYYWLMLAESHLISHGDCSGTWSGGSMRWRVAAG